MGCYGGPQKVEDVVYIERFRRLFVLVRYVESQASRVVLRVNLPVEFNMG